MSNPETTEAILSGVRTILETTVRLEGERDSLRAEHDHLKVQVTELAYFLRRITRWNDCGCYPCMGQCRCDEAKAITLDSIVDEAERVLRNFLSTNPTITLTRP